MRGLLPGIQDFLVRWAYEEKMLFQHFGLWDEILVCGHKVKATEQYFPVVLFVKLLEVILFLLIDLSQINDTELYNILLNLNLEINPTV